MTHEKLVTAPVGTTLEKAKKILHQHRIEKLPIVDESGRLSGLITIKDIEKVIQFPNSAKEALNHYIKTNDLQDYDYLFPSKKKVRTDGVRIAHIGRVAAYQILKQAAEHVGLKNIGTHSMRKSFGYHHYRRNQNVIIPKRGIGDVTLGKLNTYAHEHECSLYEAAQNEEALALLNNTNR